MALPTEAPELHVFSEDGGIPNSRLPLVLWRGRLPAEAREGQAACALYRRNGWSGTWVYTVYPFWHFHTQGHEVLGCVSGSATIGLGGEGGISAEVRPGDVCVIPAGVGHRKLEASADFLMAGGYPPGQSGDIRRPGDVDPEKARRPIARLPLPATDPILGGLSGLPELWGQAYDGK